MHENEVATKILDAGFTVHTELGPGLLESVYESSLYWELTQAGLDVKRQQAIPVVYKGIKMSQGFRSDLVVGNKVLVEIKSVELLPPVYYKVLLTYLKFSGLHLGLLLNFHESHFKDGIKRVVNNLSPDDRR